MGPLAHHKYPVRCCYQPAHAAAIPPTPLVNASCRIACAALLYPSAEAAQTSAPVQASPADSSDQSVNLTTTSAWSEPAQSDASGGLRNGLQGKSGEWLIAPIPFNSALLGAGLKLVAAPVSKAVDDQQDKDLAPRDSIAGVGGMYAQRGTWA